MKKYIYNTRSSSGYMANMVSASDDYADDYYDATGFLKEEYADYCLATVKYSKEDFLKDSPREIIDNLEESIVRQSPDCDIDIISLSTYRSLQQRDMSISVKDLNNPSDYIYVKLAYCVDENGEYDFYDYSVLNNAIYEIKFELHNAD